MSGIPHPLIPISFFPTSIKHAVCAPRAEKDNPLEGITKNIQRPAPILEGLLAMLYPTPPLTVSYDKTSWITL